MFDEGRRLIFHIASIVKAGQSVGDGHLHRGLNVGAQLLGIAAASDLGMDTRQELLPVEWTDQVLDELTVLWMIAADPRTVTRAQASIDSLLSRGPLHHGGRAF